MFGKWGRRPSGGTGARKGTAKRSPQAQEHLIDFPGVGKITVRRSLRARRITLAVRPDRTVRLTVPQGMPLESGFEFLNLKKEWLTATLAKYPAAPQVILPPFSTRNHRLVLEPAANQQGKPIRISVLPDTVIVRYPTELDPSGEVVQQAVRKAIEEAWRAEAKELLPGRLSALAATFGLKYRSVAIRNTISKWGSCSGRDDISLSLHLMRLPDHLVDYILLHELCHTVHKNHGTRFHSLLDRLTSGRHAALRRELKGYTTRW